MHTHLGTARSPWSGSRWAALVGAVLLAGCASTPLPPWPKIFKIAPPDGAPLATTNGQRTIGVTAPALPAAASGGAAASSAIPAPSLESVAVAARFVDPQVRYQTPGLVAQRGFTSDAELAQWLREAAAAAGPARARAFAIGNSQKGVPLQAIVLTTAQGTDANSIADSQRPTVLLIGQQHGDEPASAEALLVLAQELARGSLTALLARINVVIVPRTNPDGAATGTRSTANGVDLDQDHLLLSTPEAQALAQLVRDYRPDVVVDAQEHPWTHEGLQSISAVPRHDALLQYANAANLHEFVSKAAREWFHEPMLQALQAANLRADSYHTPPRTNDLHQWQMAPMLPGSARNASGLKGAVGLLVSTRGVGLGRSHLQRRVHAQALAMSAALHHTAERAESLGQVRTFVNRDTQTQGCKGHITIEAVPLAEQHDVAVLDALTGEERTLRVAWQSTLNPQPVRMRTRPCGYWLTANAAPVVERLKLLGVQVLRAAEPGALLVESFQEGPSGVAVARAAIDSAAGSYYVSLNQPLGSLVVAALEPDAPGSYWQQRLLPTLADAVRVMAVPALVFDDLE